MSDQHPGPGPAAPARPEADPRLQGYPPPPASTYPLSPYGAGPLVLGTVGTGPWGTGVRGTPPAAWGVPPRPPALPLEPRRYSQLLRGPRYRWWKPLLTALLALGLFLGLSLVSVVPPLVVGLARGVPNLPTYVLDTLTDTANLGPTGFIALNLSLVILIPTAMWSIWIVHGVRPRFLASVTGGIRWRWMARCLVVVVPVWLVYVGFTALVDQPAGDRPPQWGALLVIVLVMTPFQAAGEEYLFRGWLLQNVGAWFARPVVGLVVATVISTVAFSAAHGSPDVWVLGSIGCLAVASCLATWRTGGLEAGIAMHAVNNILVFFVTVLFGGWQDAFVGSDTTGTFLQFALSVLVHGVALALIWWQAGRAGLPYLSRPSAPSVPTTPAAPPAALASAS